MRLSIAGVLLAIGIAASACSQGGADNVMAPEGNALEPAEVNAALGPEITNTTDANMTANDSNEENDLANETNEAYPPDEPTPNGTSE
jgi:hypothetical protein